MMLPSLVKKSRPSSRQQALMLNLIGQDYLLRLLKAATSKILSPTLVPELELHQQLEVLPQQLAELPPLKKRKKRKKKSQRKNPTMTWDSVFSINLFVNLSVWTHNCNRRYMFSYASYTNIC